MVRKLRRQCPSPPVIWTDTLASLLGMLDILLFSVYSFRLSLFSPPSSVPLKVDMYLLDEPGSYSCRSLEGVRGDTGKVFISMSSSLPGFGLVVAEFC